MTEAVPRRAIQRRRRTRLNDTVLIVALLAFGFSSVFQLFWTVSAQADELSDLIEEGASDQLNSAPGPNGVADPAANASPCETKRQAFEATLPVPQPIGNGYVVQLVNESNTTLLAAADAAHQVGKPPKAVLPREGTWVIPPKGVLTVDIPPEWETTIGAGAVGPVLWARTGCRFDIAHNLAQCETGNCSGQYDCSKGNQTAPGPKALAEWTFNDTNHNSAPDISVVDGVNLNMDIEPIGPFTPNNPMFPPWLNHSLVKCGEDQRAANRCTPQFQLKRGDLSFFVPGKGGRNDVVGCFSNCGKYKYPAEPPLDCNPDPLTDVRCYYWKTFCCAFPVPTNNPPYDIPCTSDAQCTQNGACWDRGNGKPVCACRAFIKKDTCPPNVCTFPYTPQTPSFQPPFGLCEDVTKPTGQPGKCIGDDTIHQVMPYGLTWPNDPETFFSDAHAFRIVFAPGGTSVPITPSTNIPLCSSLPMDYRPVAERKVCSGDINSGALFAGARLSPTCTENSDCVVGGCNPQSRHCDSWDCKIGDGIATLGVLCRW